MSLIPLSLSRSLQDNLPTIINFLSSFPAVTLLDSPNLTSSLHLISLLPTKSILLILPFDLINIIINNETNIITIAQFKDDLLKTKTWPNYDLCVFLGPFDLTLDYQQVFSFWQNISQTSSVSKLLFITPYLQPLPLVTTVLQLESYQPAVEIYYQTKLQATIQKVLFDSIIKQLTFYLPLINGNILIFLPESSAIFKTILEKTSLDLTCQLVADLTVSDNQKGRIIYLSDSPSFAFCPELPNIEFVIDSMLQKAFVVTPQSQIWTTRMIDQNEAKGRAKLGKLCHRMTTLTNFENLPVQHYFQKDYQLAQYLENSLYSITLPESNDFKEKRMLQLLKIGANKEEIYKLMLVTGMNVRFACLVWEWIKKKYVIYPVLTLVAMLNCFNNDYFVYPTSSRLNPAYYEHELMDRQEYFNNKFGGISDIHTFFNLIASLSSIDFRQPNELLQFTHRHHLNYTAFTKVVENLNHLVTGLTQLGYIVEYHSFDVNKAIQLIQPILAQVYQDSIFNRVDLQYQELNPVDTNRKNPIINFEYQDPNDQQLYTLATHQSINKLGFARPTKIIVLLTSRFISDLYSFNTIDISMNLS